jgi:hypothetical protein
MGCVGGWGGWCVFEMQKIILTLDTSKFSEVENLYSPRSLPLSSYASVSILTRRYVKALGTFICLLHLVGGKAQVKVIARANTGMFKMYPVFFSLLLMDV